MQPVLLTEIKRPLCLLVDLLLGCRTAPVHLDPLCLKIPGATVQVFFTILEWFMLFFNNKKYSLTSGAAVGAIMYLVFI